MVIDTIEDLINQIIHFSLRGNKTVILMDRIDYLINRYSFENFINAIYDIHDNINHANSIFILQVNPFILSEMQLAILDDELKSFPKHDGMVSKTMSSLNDLLLFINQEEEGIGFASFKQIIHHLNLTYPTIRKRLRLLEGEGMVVTYKHGQFKRVQITEKGKKFLKMMC